MCGWVFVSLLACFLCYYHRAGLLPASVYISVEARAAQAVYAVVSVAATAARAFRFRSHRPRQYQWLRLPAALLGRSLAAAALVLLQLRTGCR